MLICVSSLEFLWILFQTANCACPEWVMIFSFPILCHATSFFFSLPTVNGTIIHSINNNRNPRVILEFSFNSNFTPSQSAVPVNLPLKTHLQCIQLFHLHNYHLLQGTIISHLVCSNSLQAVLLVSFISSPINLSLHSSQNWILPYHSLTQNSWRGSVAS